MYKPIVWENRPKSPSSLNGIERPTFRCTEYTANVSIRDDSVAVGIIDADTAQGLFDV